jgi:hypothetical protein
LTGDLDELRKYVGKLRRAQTPEAIFGDLSGAVDDMLAILRQRYREILKTHGLHPDIRPGTEDDALAQEGFRLLTQLRDRAETKITYGSYGVGVSSEPVNLTSSKHTYTVHDLLATGDLCNVYRCTYTVGGQDKWGIFKVARDPADNDLARTEGAVLEYLQSAVPANQFPPFVPQVLDAIVYQDAGSPAPLQAHVLTMHEDITSPKELYTLEEVREHYTGGIHPKDMAWIWRRLLTALGFAHQNSVVHGAVLPSHVLIEPKNHKLLLIDWSYAVHDPQKSGRRIRAISNAYADWYPAEVFAKEVPTPGLDVFMAARCMIYLLGVDPTGDTKPANLEPALERYLARCLRQTPRGRPQDAWKALDDFDQLIEVLWGPREFREFALPSKA